MKNNNLEPVFNLDDKKPLINCRQLIVKFKDYINEKNKFQMKPKKAKMEVSNFFHDDVGIKNNEEIQYLSPYQKWAVKNLHESTRISISSKKQESPQSPQPFDLSRGSQIEKNSFFIPIQYINQICTERNGKGSSNNNSRDKALRNISYSQFRLGIQQSFTFFD